jgi:hypothetical protein
MHKSSSPQDKAIAALLNQMNASLDEARAAICSARSAIRKNLNKIDAMQETQQCERRKRSRSRTPPHPH